MASRKLGSPPERGRSRKLHCYLNGFFLGPARSLGCVVSHDAQLVMVGDLSAEHPMAVSSHDYHGYYIDSQPHRPNKEEAWSVDSGELISRACSVTRLEKKKKHPAGIERAPSSDTGHVTRRAPAHWATDASRAEISPSLCPRRKALFPPSASSPSRPIYIPVMVIASGCALTLYSSKTACLDSSPV